MLAGSKADTACDGDHLCSPAPPVAVTPNACALIATLLPPQYQARCSALVVAQSSFVGAFFVEYNLGRLIAGSFGLGDKAC